MRKSIAVMGVALLFTLAAAAQDTPKMETFLGYTYVRANSATNVPAFSANGGSGQFAYNFNKWLSGVADVGAVHSGNISGFHLDSTIANFVFGPRVSLRYSRLRPYFQTLFGGVYAATSTRVVAIPVAAPLATFVPTPIPGEPITARLGAQQTAFAMTIGGGLDIKISKHLSFRPIGLDYYMTRLQDLRTQGDNNQNNLRYTTGFNFTFGAQ